MELLARKNEFTLTEIRLIQSLLTKQSDEDIAELLDRPVEAVSEKIRELCTITGKKSFAVATKERQHKKVINKRKDKANLEMQKSAELQVKIKKREKQVVQRRQPPKPEPTKLATKHVDYSKLISVRINSKTIIYAKPGEDIEQLKKRVSKLYKNNL